MTGTNGRAYSHDGAATVYVEGADFRAERIVFRNTAGERAGQAPALYVRADRASFVSCGFEGWQDTLRVEGRAWFDLCRIEGHCDFIYGAGPAFFERCEVHGRAGGYITASSADLGQPFGFVFRRCRVTTEKGARQFLGRPWKPTGSVTWIVCDLQGDIWPAGWDNWRDPSREKFARFSEYASTGPGANPSARVAWSRQLSREDADAITPAAVLGGWTSEAIHR